MCRERAYADTLVVRSILYEVTVQYTRFEFLVWFLGV